MTEPLAAFPEMRAALFMTLIDYRLKSDDRDRRGPRVELRNGKKVHVYPDHSDIMNEALFRIVAIMQGERAPEDVLQEIEDNGGVKA